MLSDGEFVRISPGSECTNMLLDLILGDFWKSWMYALTFLLGL